jgi:hypothetical protein
VAEGLIVAGSDRNDLIRIVPQGRPTDQNAAFMVFINGVNQGVFTGVDSIKIYTLAGDDFVHLAGNIRVSVTVFDVDGEIGG